MEWWQAIILGLVEGITEYLPISSTGHLILTAELLGLGETPQQKASVDAFNIVIQGGAILAVLGLYRERVAQIIRGLLGRDVVGRRLAVNLLIAFLPAAIFGVMLDEPIERLLFSATPVLTALFIGGVFMIALDYWKVRPLRRAEAAGDTGGHDVDSLSWKAALIIGLLQCVAMWPGTSRSMMTIAGGVIVGLRPRAAAEFSFLLGLPTLGGACVYKLAKNIKQAQETGGPNLFQELGGVNVALGIVFATASAALAVRWLVGFLNRHGLAAFGWYRIALTAVMAALVVAGLVDVGGPSRAVLESGPE
mgnify:FL=1